MKDPTELIPCIGITSQVCRLDFLEKREMIRKTSPQRATSSETSEGFRKRHKCSCRKGWAIDKIFVLSFSQSHPTRYGTAKNVNNTFQILSLTQLGLYIIFNLKLRIRFAFLTLLGQKFPLPPPYSHKVKHYNSNGIDLCEVPI